MLCVALRTDDKNRAGGDAGKENAFNLTVKLYPEVDLNIAKPLFLNIFLHYRAKNPV